MKYLFVFHELPQEKRTLKNKSIKNFGGKMIQPTGFSIPNTWDDFLTAVDGNTVTTKDGQVSLEEFVKFLTDKGIEPGSPAYNRALQVFGFASNGDGQLSASEFASVTLERPGDDDYATFASVLDSILKNEGLSPTVGDDSDVTVGLSDAGKAGYKELVGKVETDGGSPTFAFKDMDLDGDEEVTDAEFAAYLNAYGIEPGTDAANAAWSWFGDAKDDGKKGTVLSDMEYEQSAPPTTLTGMTKSEGEGDGGGWVLGETGTAAAAPATSGETGFPLAGDMFPPGWDFPPGVSTVYDENTGQHYFVGMDDKGNHINLGVKIDGKGEQALYARMVAGNPPEGTKIPFGYAKNFAYLLDNQDVTAGDQVDGTPVLRLAGNGENTRVVNADGQTVFMPSEVNTSTGKTSDNPPHFVGKDKNGFYVDLGATLDPQEAGMWLNARPSFNWAEAVTAFAGKDGMLTGNEVRLLQKYVDSKDIAVPTGAFQALLGRIGWEDTRSVSLATAIYYIGDDPGVTGASTDTATKAYDIVFPDGVMPRSFEEVNTTVMAALTRGDITVRQASELLGVGSWKQETAHDGGFIGLSFRILG